MREDFAVGALNTHVASRAPHSLQVTCPVCALNEMLQLQVRKIARQQSITKLLSLLRTVVERGRMWSRANGAANIRGKGRTHLVDSEDV